MGELRERAVEVALAALGDRGMPIAFVLATGRDGKLHHFMIVTDRSDNARTAGRQIVAEKADLLVEYAIVVDSYVRIDGERHDAILVEECERGAQTARVFGYAHENAKLVFDAPVFVERAASALPLDPVQLDWGAVTPDRYNKDQNLVVHVISHELGSADNVRRTVRFVRARMRYFGRHLPGDARHSIFVEDRGQAIGAAARATLARAFANVEIKYLSEDQ